jgi:predicted nucleotidyltransferase
MVEALLEIVNIFQKHKVHYCLIGGLAMMLHQGRANTVDIDFYVLVDDLKKVKELFEGEKLPVETRGEYQLKAKVGTVPIDVLYADHYIGAEVVHRAAEKKLGDIFVRVATPEDLIILKTLANRTIDRRDIEELRELYGKKLDENYIERQLTRLKMKLDS